MTAIFPGLERNSAVHGSRYSERQPWLLIRVKPATEAGFRRWNLIVIWCLTFVVLSVFAMGLTPQAGHARSNGPLRVGGGVQAPRLIRKIQPLYPQLANATRTQGEVVLDCVIDEHGNVTQMKLVSGHPLLVKAAFAAVQQWKYEPTLLNGMPIAVEMRVTVNFVLGDNCPTSDCD
jgi:TonB family protein